MRVRNAVATFAVAVFVLYAAGAAAQHEQHHAGQEATQGQSTPGMMGQRQGMMGTMSQMTTCHQQMSELVTKLMESMKAIESEKDPAKVKQRLAEHRALLEQMHKQMMRQGSMMKTMSGQVQQNCPMMGANQKPGTK